MEEWIQKTEKLRTYPRHLRYTLFYQAQEKLQQVHTKEFPMVFFIYDDIIKILYEGDFEEKMEQGQENEDNNEDNNSIKNTQYILSSEIYEIFNFKY